MTKKEIANIAVEAAKLRKDYPEMGYRKAIAKAKEMLTNENKGIDRAN